MYFIKYQRSLIRFFLVGLALNCTCYVCGSGFAKGRLLSRQEDRVIVDTVTWNDHARNRDIPVAFYDSKNIFEHRPGKKKKLIILSPGYQGKQTDYRYIAEKLALAGYFVVVIQHDLTTDLPMPSTGNIYQARLPFWKNGISNILFVINKLKQRNHDLDYAHMILIGHSNGGDISMLFGTLHPKNLRTIITLDNRRMPFLKNGKISVLSIRSNDQKADPGVLPSFQEQKKFRIRIIKVETAHDQMGGDGTVAQLQEIDQLILGFLSQ